MRCLLPLCFFASPLFAGQLDIKMSINLEDSCYSALMAFRENRWVVLPKPVKSKDGKTLIYTLPDLEKGKYRVTLDALNPLCRHASYMEIHVVVGEQSKHELLLKRPERPEQKALPEEVRKALEKHPRKLIELKASYEGANKPFVQTRQSGADIWYTRRDATYTLKIFNQALDVASPCSEVVYQKQFKAVEAKQK